MHIQKHSWSFAIPHEYIHSDLPIHQELTERHAPDIQVMVPVNALVQEFAPPSEPYYSQVLLMYEMMITGR